MDHNIHVSGAFKRQPFEFSCFCPFYLFDFCIYHPFSLYDSFFFSLSLSLFQKSFFVNAKTAIFEVDKDAAHGSNLVCSYPSCRNSGVRFLYCKYCDAAISRRGFKIKHSHPELQEQSGNTKRTMGSPNIASLSSSSSNNDSMMKIASPPASKRIKQVENKAGGGDSSKKAWPQQEKDSISSGGDGLGAVGPAAAAAAAGLQQLFTVHVKSDINNNDHDKEYPSSSSSSRRRRIKKLRTTWVRLLEECRDHHGVPNLSETKSEWVRKVVAVYDDYTLLTKPPSASEDDDGDSAAAGGDNSQSE
jgi:hypothetical protein